MRRDLQLMPAAAKPAAHNTTQREPTGSGKDELSLLRQRYCQPAETAIATDIPFSAAAARPVAARPPGLLIVKGSMV